MEAIITKYHGPTDTRGSRISAKVRYGLRSRTYSYPYRHDLMPAQNHTHAARLTAERLGLDDTTWHAGELPDGYVFVAASPWSAEMSFSIPRDDNR